MLEHTITEESAIKCIALKGRIDALTSSDVGRILDALILEGERTLVVDMTSVNYVSSAGLRALLMSQKELKKVGGEIILLGMIKTVFDVFDMSGLTGVFRILKDRGEIAGLLRSDRQDGVVNSFEDDIIRIEWREKEAGKGTLFTVGSPDKTESSGYSERDVVAVKAEEMKHGCGLAVLGDTYEEYKRLFGESMVVNGNFFFYPAVKHSSVDFLISADRDPAITYKFLHGFGFNGPDRYVLSFQGKDTPLGLDFLIDSFFRVSPADILGITVIAESKGIWGMHMKQVPLLEHKPLNGKSIFDKENFSAWVDFPLDPSYGNHVVVATGIAARDRSCLRPEKQSLIAEGGRFHIHAGIFEKAPIGRNPGDFDKELMRVIGELQAYRVQHLLSRSRFSSGMGAIVEIEG